VNEAMLRSNGPMWIFMFLNGPHRTQPPPDPRGSVTAPPEMLSSSGLYSPSPERELSLQSKSGLAFRFSDHNGQFQYLGSVIMGWIWWSIVLTGDIQCNHTHLAGLSPRARGSDGATGGTDH
jgi:hypothetical protein